MAGKPQPGRCSLDWGQNAWFCGVSGMLRPVPSTIFTTATRFKFSFKAPQRVTHCAKLRECAEVLAVFHKAVATAKGTFEHRSCRTAIGTNKLASGGSKLGSSCWSFNSINRQSPRFRAFDKLAPTPEKEGTGHGMAIVKQIVKAHVGTVNAESDHATGSPSPLPSSGSIELSTPRALSGTLGLRMFLSLNLSMFCYGV